MALLACEGFGIRYAVRIIDLPTQGAENRSLKTEISRTLLVTSALMPNYNRADLAFERGEGAWLTAVNGRRYLDFGAGIATSSLGHAHPGLTGAIAAQAAKVMHVSNLYRVPEAERLAERLTAHSFAEAAFFCNSGAEANEGLVKLIRRTQSETGHPERWRMICFQGAFHGRTLAMLSATGNPKYQAGFGPAVDGFDQVPPGDIAAVRAAITPETAGILIEPIQGEGGIRVIALDFLRQLRALCDEHGLLLGYDEIQCGMGRTGRLWAHEWAHDAAPDVMSSAKGIAGGFPMGAVLARHELARHLTPGTHGTTYGGNPLACAAANAVLDVVLAPGFLDAVQQRGQQLRTGLEAIVLDYPQIFKDVRGKGLLLGLLCGPANTAVQEALRKNGLLSVAAGENVLRLAPPLVVTEADCDAALSIIRETAATLAREMVGAAS
ncbi:Acetylornithine aminotransferase [Granulibacter bethesdensis]|uniref:Acetylornithine aminotransferase n=1 Tax=Granulibacter bethesdensis TaxID=364410 RepID=A0AAC9KBX2_9PROT|nr:Acetylornithine aminotransferase [Granulibacter bethesdensis]APH63186.1 Acetylornithine aminotransferase [Granulibacter bethesdensis]